MLHFRIIGLVQDGVKICKVHLSNTASEIYSKQSLNLCHIRHCKCGKVYVESNLS